MNLENKNKTSIYIDAANLDKGTRSNNFQIDYKKLYVYLKNKFDFNEVIIFIGYLEKYKNFYDKLNRYGYKTVFKEIVEDDKGNVKGNCDADIVVSIMEDYYEKRVEKVVLVSSDGDYACIVKFLKKKDSFESLISPRDNCSYLLRKENIKIIYINDIKNKIIRDIK